MPGTTQTVTNKWLLANRTPAGGYTRAQLQVLGVPWPPAKGWKAELIGTPISQSAMDLVEGLSAEAWRKARET